MEKPDYGIDVPHVIRNLFLIGAACLLAYFLVPQTIHLGRVDLDIRGMFLFPGIFLIAEGLLFLLYVKIGKFRHRDFMLGMYAWRGGEQILDVGCGRGLLLAGAAKRLLALPGAWGATGIDIWSNVDMGGNSEAATRRNLELEGVSGSCTLVSAGAEEMPFADGSYDLILSNLCLHNIYDKQVRRKALAEIARVLRPGGLALISDYKLTASYAAEFAALGLEARMRWGSWLTTFPPLRVVIARKPQALADAPPANLMRENARPTP